MHDLEKKLKAPGMEYRNETRWWLAEGLHTDQTLKEDMQMLEESGFGGVEFLAMEEYGADSARYGWGSEEWIHDSHLLLEEATERGMAASMTSGTNWSNANLLNIVPDDKAASKELEFVTVLLEGGQIYDGELCRPVLKNPDVHEQTLIAVVASRVQGETEGLIEKEGIVLTDQAAEGRLRWRAPEGGQWILFFFWMHGTGQRAYPSCGKSYTVNYIDPYGSTALIDYWNKEVLTPQMCAFIQKNKRVQLYMDSLELGTFGKGGQFWGYHLMEEFQTRRGYDLAPFLPLIVKKQGFLPIAQYYYSCGDDDFEFRLRNDLYQTMTDLYMENMLKPLQSWLHEAGMGLRAEISYGMPFEISQPGKYVDGVETESHEFVSQIDYFRGLAGTAHIYDRTFSSETGATIYNYKMPLNFYQQIIFTQFAAGVVRTVMHGYSSEWGSDEATRWPGHEGMWLYFSERFGRRQPAYRHYKDWNKMIERYQYLLRQGKPRVDLGILRLDYAYDCDCTMDISMYEKQYMRSNQGIYWQDPALQNAGYTYEYFAPQILEDMEFGENVLQPGGPGYQALLVYQEALPLAAARKLLTFARQGLKVVLADGVTENVSTTFHKEKFHARAAMKTPFLDGKDEELGAVIEEMKALPNVRTAEGYAQVQSALEELGVYPRAPFAQPNKEILSCLRDDKNKKYLYLYHYMYQNEEPVTFAVSLEGAGALYQINCWTGKVKKVDGAVCGNGKTTVTLTLKPGEATMLVLDMEAERKTVEASAGADACAGTAAAASGTTEAGGMTAAHAAGAAAAHTAPLPDPIRLDKWHLQVESWDEGAKKERTEDRGLGYVTREYFYETEKTMLDAGVVELKPWTEIQAIGPDVSGIGFYRCSFTLPQGLEPGMGAKLKLGSTQGNTAAVYVNGQKAEAVDFCNPTVDITGLLMPGENQVLVEVATTLNNRLHQKEYYARIAYRQAMLFGWKLPEDPYAHTTEPFQECWKSEQVPYGLTGEASVEFYRV